MRLAHFLLLSFLLLEILISVDLDGQLVFLEVINEELRNAFNVVLMVVIEYRRLVFALAHRGCVLLLIRVKVVFAVYVAAEVLWQFFDIADLHLKI